MGGGGGLQGTLPSMDGQLEAVGKGLFMLANELCQ